MVSPSEASCQLAATLLRTLPLDYPNTLHLLLQQSPGIGSPLLLLCIMRSGLFEALWKPCMSFEWHSDAYAYLPVEHAYGVQAY